MASRSLLAAGLGLVWAMVSGMVGSLLGRHSRARGNPVSCDEGPWIPAFAGMTSVKLQVWPYARDRTSAGSGVGLDRAPPSPPPHNRHVAARRRRPTRPG